jgi:phenylpropionate dioxygenase-like ring-hydroxylating dioxygenase large terminal subunit
VRGDDGRLRAFQNVCRHRGNSICQGTGRGLTELRCPFHRWAWSIDGALREVPSRRAFGPLDPDELGLFPAQVDTFGRVVFVNLDLDAAPLGEWLEGVPEDLSWCRMDDFRCAALVVKQVPANWKVVVDGFSETYHIQGIHREMLGHVDDVHALQRLWHRHGASYQQYGVPSPRLGPRVRDEEVWDSWMACMGERLGLGAGAPMPPVPPSTTVQEVIAEGLVAHQAARGVDISMYDTARLTAISQYNLFPNATLLAMPDLVSVLSARPGPSPDESEFVMMHLYPAPPGAPRTDPVTMALPLDTDVGLVMNQDFGAMQTVQRGLHQPGLRHLVVSAEECRLVNQHRALEEWLGTGGTPDDIEA